MIREQRYIDVDQYWPVSHFLPRYPWWQELFMVVGIGVLFRQLLVWYRQGRSMSLLLGLSLLLVMATNGLLGYKSGLIDVVAHQGNSYWDDVNKMTSMTDLLTYYTVLQPDLHLHSRVHPPGPMLLIYSLRSVWDHPLFIGLVIAAIGVMGGWFLYQLLLTFKVSERMAAFGGLLLVLLPASQIYYWSTVDAVICTLVIAVLFFWQRMRRFSWKWGMALILSLSLLASMTFAVVFVGPVLLFDDWRRHANIRRGLLLIGLMIGLMLFTRLLTGYDYYQGFEIARSYEGPAGPYALVDTWSYVITRIENVLELLIFFSPILSLLLFKGLQSVFCKDSARWLTLVGAAGIVSLLVFFLAGGYYTGETARAALYIYPFLLMPIIGLLDKVKVSWQTRKRLLYIVFGQTVLMQLFGWYAW